MRNLERKYLCGKISRIWLISMTVGNAGYPAKWTLFYLSKKKRNWNQPSNEESNKIKIILNSMGVSCWGASEEQNVMSDVVFLKGVGKEWDLVLGNLTSAKLGWKEVDLGIGLEMGETNVLEKTEAAIGFEVSTAQFVIDVIVWALSAYASVGGFNVKSKARRHKQGCSKCYVTFLSFFQLGRSIPCCLFNWTIQPPPLCFFLPQLLYVGSVLGPFQMLHISFHFSGFYIFILTPVKISKFSNYYSLIQHRQHFWMVNRLFRIVNLEEYSLLIWKRSCFDIFKKLLSIGEKMHGVGRKIVTFIVRNRLGYIHEDSDHISDQL